GGGYRTDGELRLWDVRTGQRRLTLAGDAGPFLAVAFSPDGQTLAAGDEAGVTLWGVPGGRVRHALGGQRGGVRSVAFADGGRLLAVGDRGGAGPARGRRAGEGRG